MQNFVHCRNIEHYRKLLAGKLEASERKSIALLLREELAKDPPAVRAVAEAEPSDS